jgi:hypothetical protein
MYPLARYKNAIQGNVAQLSDIVGWREMRDGGGRYIFIFIFLYFYLGQCFT